MSTEQTAYVGDNIKVLVNVIDSTGSHAAAVINTSTTRLNGFSTVPTVNTISTGIYEVVFASVTPAPVEADRLICKINGTMGGTAWTEYGIPVLIVADERGTNNASTFDYTTNQVTVAANNDKTGYSLVVTPPTALQVADAVWDEILTGATHNIPTSAGRRLRQIADVGLYEGAQVWIDTVNGSAGTTDYEDGTVDNPSNNIADATTIANSVGITNLSV